MGNSQAKTDPAKRAMRYIKCRQKCGRYWFTMSGVASDLYATVEQVRPAFDRAIAIGLIEWDEPSRKYRTIHKAEGVD
jgi:hypothetical protein